MQNQQTFGIQGQRPPSWGIAWPVMRYIHSGGKLGNEALQAAARPINNPEIISDKSTSLEPPLSRFEVLKKQKFTAEGRVERIAKSLAALYQEEPIKLPPEEWISIAEDPDLEDQF